MEKPVKKRGRPAKGGAQDVEAFFRALEVLSVYHEARKPGEKHSTAVSETVRRLKAKYKICETTVKRILAELQPARANVVFTVGKPTSNREIILEGHRMRAVMALGIGPRPRYRRANARQRVSCETRKGVATRS
jgi:hypothetical protein